LVARLSSHDDGDDVGREKQRPVVKAWRKGNSPRFIAQVINFLLLQIGSNKSAAVAGRK